MRNDDKLWREWEADVDQVLRSQIEGLYREADEAEDTSSPEFLERMTELLGMEEQERPKRTHRRKHAKVAKVAGVAALFALLIGVSQMNPNADWSFGKLFEKVYDEFVLGSSDDKVVLTEVGPEVNNQIAEQFPGISAPTRMPEGYEQIEIIGVSTDDTLFKYSNGEERILYQQKMVTDVSGLDGEKKITDSMYVDGVLYESFEKKEDGITYSGLMWKIGSHEYNLLAALDTNSLIDIAQSVKVLGG